MIFKKEMDINGKTLSIEAGKVAKQADGAVVVRYGDTMVLATVVAAKEPRTDMDYFPLFVEYRESMYAAGKIPGGFFKREGRPGDDEVLSARLIDRQIRPMFPKGFKNETIVTVNVISSDQQNKADVLGSIGISAALTISNIPFDGPTASVRVAKVDGQLVLNPVIEEIEKATMELIVAGTADSVTMVEGEAGEISEAEMLEAINFGHGHIKSIIAMLKELGSECGVEKREFVVEEAPAGLEEKVTAMVKSQVEEADRIKEKAERANRMSEIKKETVDALAEEYPEDADAIKSVIEDLHKAHVRKMILEENLRLDGRDSDTVRPIDTEVGYLPRTHGSSLFTRGQTQALGTVTLGTKSDEQIIDSIDVTEFTTRKFMLHYNFPHFSVGEARMPRGVSRREVGHGKLAERAIKQVLPDREDFPYTIRVVSTVLESNGSSSMATVCAASMALMDAGVPTKGAVAGIAMGLIKEGDKVAILTDILGDEDHLGDMDFKVAGTEKGITAFQMDIKVQGIPVEIMQQALDNARKARLFILDKMKTTIEQPRPDISPFAPRLITFKLKSEQIGAIIGPGGKMIREIIAKSGILKFEIEEDGTATIASVDGAAAEVAMAMVNALIEEPEAGKTYMGTVKKIMPFGAFVEIIPGKEGLLHISEIDHKRVEKVEDYLKQDDKVEVLLRKIDPKNGKMELSRKALIQK